MSASNKSKFEKYMKMWNQILSLLGVSPVSWYLNDKGELEYRESLLKKVISVLVVAVSVLIVYAQTTDKSFDISNIPKLLITGYLNIISSVVTILKTASAMWNSKPYATLATDVLKFNRNSLNARVDVILVSSTKFISFYLLLMFFAFLFDFFILDEDKDLITLKFLLNYFGGFYTFMSVCQFAVSCLWMRTYLLDINKEIKKHSKSFLFEERITIFRLNCAFPGGSPRSKNTVSTPGLISNVSLFTFQCLQETAVHQIKYIRRLYHQVYVLSDQVNRVFSTGNCIAVTHNFFLCTILIYCGLGEINKYMNNKSNLKVLEIINYFKYSAMCFLFIYGLIWPSTTIYSQTAVTARLIGDFFSKVSKGELQAELHSFIIQLHQEKICFSPHGFFFLNDRLLLSIIGSVASYLVILIQFRVVV